MIRREAEDGYWLITQHHHALLSGELARQLGPIFEQPGGAVIEAIANHDCGWPIHDDCPTLNQQGLPLHVFETPPGVSTRVWNESVARAGKLGDYQGLLVSLHVLNLSAIGMSHAQQLSRGDLFEMNKFQHRQIEIQEELRAKLGLSNELPRRLGLAKTGMSVEDDRLMFDFRLLTLMDRISLNLCCGSNLFPSIDDVMTRPGAVAATMNLAMPDAQTLEVEPWPFDDSTLTFEIPARRVGRGPFASVEQFRDAYAAAPVERLAGVLRRRI